MISRKVSTKSSRPAVSPKPLSLRASSIMDHDDDSFLHEDLLGGEDEDAVSSVSTESPKIAKQHQPPPADAGSRRLVIGIDYGTTFTGE
jgi:hypothetical protein